MGNRFLRIAVIYAVLGVGLGVFMGATTDFTQKPVHVHMNLLGWVSMALFGFFYRAFPAAGESTLGKAHFWLHNVSLPIMMIALAMLYAGNKAVGPILGIASAVMGISFICFAINLWKHTGE